jgi:UrcA family protein
MTRLLLTACLATVISGGLASQVSAEDHIVIETGGVTTRDLNLATERGADVLVRRVTAKAADLCTQTDTPLARGQDRTRRQCVAEAVAQALAKIDSPLIQAAYARQRGVAPAALASR